MHPISWQRAGRLGSCCLSHRRLFHDYFVTHLPSSSLHPDSRSSAGPSHHKLPRADSSPHNPGAPGPVPTSLPQSNSQGVGPRRETTVVRIPLKSAKHHFGAGILRGARPYNEDKYQAGTIEIPAFAQRQPVSVSRRQLGKPQEKENKAAQSASGDPQVFYFGVFDGHGGEECSNFLRDRMHTYIEDAAQKFGTPSSLKVPESEVTNEENHAVEEKKQNSNKMQRALVESWVNTVGGYFKRFRPEYFTISQRGSSSAASASSVSTAPVDPLSAETMLSYAFLKADLDFTQAQAHKHSPGSTSNDPILDDRPLNESDVLSHPAKPASQNLTKALKEPIGGKTRFKGGSTASIALVSTPTPTPFWHPASPVTILAVHVGDTRILLCRVHDGQAVALTNNHHPSAPVEATRLRRYAAAFVTDSFGEERVLGLANTRAFGDISSKRIGVSAEPEITRTQLAPSECSFMVLMSDGVSGTLTDQEVVDIVKEARTPDQASRDVVNFATEISEEADNATCLVVRLGGWERRNEGGGGSLGTKEMRDFKKRDAEDPRSRRQ